MSRLRMMLDPSPNPPNLFLPKNVNLRPSPMDRSPKVKVRSLHSSRYLFVRLRTWTRERTILSLSIVKTFWKTDGTHDKR